VEFAGCETAWRPPPGASEFVVIGRFGVEQMKTPPGRDDAGHLAQEGVLVGHVLERLEGHDGIARTAR